MTARSRLGRALQRDGFARVERYEGLDIAALRREVKSHIASLPPESIRPAMLMTPHLAHIKPILTNPVVQAVVAEHYGGAPSEITAYAIVHLGQNVTRSNYFSGLWHHDRCGRRLKLFVFLDDVGLRDHPTWVARGSHRLYHFNYDFNSHGKLLSRITDEYVEKAYAGDLVPLTGPAGGGFIFDTNSVHRGDVDGVHSERNVVVVEFHSVEFLKNVRSRVCPIMQQVGVHKILVGSQALTKPGDGSQATTPLSMPPHACMRYAPLITTGECVHVKLATTCPAYSGSAMDTVCLPIEPLVREEWRVGNDENTQKLMKGTVYKSKIVDIAKYPRRFYFDLGANSYSSSIQNWFKLQYPGASTFDHILAVEAEHTYDESYRNHSDVELIHAAAWIRDTNVPWGLKFVLAGNSSSPRAREKYGVRGMRRALDIAGLLQRRCKVEDFVVVKLDVEGAEWDIIPHLINKGVLPLIDDFFVEMHTDANSCCRGRKDRSREFAIRMLERLRQLGAYTHEYN